MKMSYDELVRELTSLRQYRPDLPVTIYDPSTHMWSFVEKVTKDLNGQVTLILGKGGD